MPSHGPSATSPRRPWRSYKDSTIRACGDAREVSGKGDVPSRTADTIVERLVYASAERLLLDADHGPVIWEYPRAAARREVRVCRGAEDGARDARYGRQWDAGEQQLHRESEDSRVFAEVIAKVPDGQRVVRRDEGERVHTCEPRVDGGDADVVRRYDRVYRTHKA